MGETLTEPLISLRDYILKEANGAAEEHQGLKELVVPYLSVNVNQIIKSPSEKNLSLSNLEILHISSQPKFKLAYADIKILCDGILDSKGQIRPKYIILPSHNMGDNAIRFLARLLSNHGKYSSNVSYLDVKGNNITEKGIKAIKHNLLLNADSGKFQDLFVGCNPLGAEGGKDLVEIVEKTPSLLSVDVKSTDIKQSQILAILSVLYEQGVANKSNDSAKGIENLGLQNSRLFSCEDIVPSHLSRVLASSSIVKQINYSNNNLPDSGLELITDSLESSNSFSKLHSFYLSANKISATGAELLSQYLMNCAATSIKVLDLEKNDIADDGAEALAVALTKNSSLQKLNVRSNGITNIGLTNLLRAMNHNSTLKTFLLWGNYFYSGTTTPNLSSTSSQALLNIQDRWTTLNVCSDVKPYIVDNIIQLAEVNFSPEQFGKDI